MTLLSEYQALPGEPAPVSDNDSELRALLKAAQGLARRDAIVRLLCRALREAESALPHVLSERRKIMADKIGALLTAVERDFPEEA